MGPCPQYAIGGVQSLWGPCPQHVIGGGTGTGGALSPAWTCTCQTLRDCGPAQLDGAVLVGQPSPGGCRPEAPGGTVLAAGHCRAMGTASGAHGPPAALGPSPAVGPRTWGRDGERSRGGAGPSPRALCSWAQILSLPVFAQGRRVLVPSEAPGHRPPGGFSSDGPWGPQPSSCNDSKTGESPGAPPPLTSTPRPRLGDTPCPVSPPPTHHSPSPRSSTLPSQGGRTQPGPPSMFS